MEKKALIVIIGLLSIIILLLIIPSKPKSKSSKCYKSTADMKALNHARSNYGLGASAVGCRFSTGSVRQSGNDYYVTVYCGGMNPIDYTLRCTSSGLKIVSVRT